MHAALVQGIPFKQRRDEYWAVMPGYEHRAMKVLRDVVKALQYQSTTEYLDALEYEPGAVRQRLTAL